MMRKKPVLLFEESYLSLIKNGVGSKMFRNFYGVVGGKKRDLLKNGVLSCAYFVSSVLKNFRLIKEIHLTVAGTQKDMADCDWKRIEKKNAKPGCVVVWESKKDRDGEHRHIGFYLGKNRAVSNDTKKQKIVSHHLTYNGKRKMESVWNPPSIIKNK